MVCFLLTRCPGAAIQYTVREAQDAWAANYTSQNGTAQNGYTVTNTYNGGTKEQQLTKVWVDGNNVDNTTGRSTVSNNTRRRTTR